MQKATVQKDLELALTTNEVVRKYASKMEKAIVLFLAIEMEMHYPASRYRLFLTFLEELQDCFASTILSSILAIHSEGYLQYYWPITYC